MASRQLEYQYRKREKINELKSRPCSDCGVQYAPWIMQFDHRNAAEKRFNIGENKFSYGMRRISEEIAKCDVVCANCHANRTYERKKG